MPYAYLGTFYNAHKGNSKVSLPFCAWSAVMWVFYHNPSLGPIPDLKLTDSCLSDIWKATSQNFFFLFCWDLGMEPQVSGMLAKQGYICLHPCCNLNWHFLYCVSVGFISSVENVYAFPVWGLTVSHLFYVSLLAWWHILWTWLHMCIIYAIRELALCLPHYVAKHFSYFIIYYFNLFYFPVLNIL